MSIEIIIAGVVATCLAFFFLMAKLNLKRMLYFDVPLDIGLTALLMWAFAGTFSGMLTAMFGGAAFSMILWGAKRLYGYQRPTMTRGRLTWVDAG